MATPKTKIDLIRLTGRSGQTYDFRVYVWGTRFKALGGVYVVASRSIEPNQPPRYEPVFVGMTEDLSNAIKDHPRSDCFQMYYANVVGLLPLDDEIQRQSIVQDLVEALGPPCNAADTE